MKGSGHCIYTVVNRHNQIVVCSVLLGFDFLFLTNNKKAWMMVDGCSMFNVTADDVFCRRRLARKA